MGSELPVPLTMAAPTGYIELTTSPEETIQPLISRRDSTVFDGVLQKVEEEIKSQQVEDDEIAEMQGKDDWRKEQKQLRELVENKSVISLIQRYFVSRAFFVIDILLMVVFFFYLDFCLDLKMMWTFYQQGDMMFLMMNASGIALGVLATFAQMVSLVHKRGAIGIDGRFLLLLGFATTLQLHVVSLGIYSIYTGEKSVFLFAAKLMESVVEATISSLVQTYAVIFEQLQDSTMWVASASISMSYLSIAYCYAKFDSSDTRILGLPGRKKDFFYKGSWPGTLSLVFVARTCEITSRIISLGLFAKSQLHGVNERCTPTGGRQMIAFVGFVDVAANLLMTGYEQVFKHGMWGNMIYGAFGVFCHVNPILERRNVASMKYLHYYLLRVLELALMLYLAQRCEPCEKLWTIAQHELVYVFLCTTAGWMVLFPVIRLRFVGEGLLEWSPEMFAEAKLSNVEQLFRDSLMDIRRVLPEGGGMLEGFTEDQMTRGLRDKIKRSVRFHLLCKNALVKTVERLEGKFKVTADAPKKAGVGWAGIGKRGIGEMKEKFVELREGADADALKEKDTTSSCSCNDTCRANVHWWCFGFLLDEERALKRWVDNMNKKYASKEEAEASLGSHFHSLKQTAANLAPYLKQVFLKSDCPVDRMGSKWNECFLTRDHQRAQNKLYVRILRALNHALARDETSQKNELEVELMKGLHFEELRSLIPPVKKLDSDNSGSSGLQLYTEKCRYVEKLISLGFAESSSGFAGKARELLSSFNVQSKASIEFDEEVDATDKAQSQTLMLKEQSHMLALIYSKTPLKKLKELFGPREDVEDEDKAVGVSVGDKIKEMRVLLDGARIHVQERDQPRYISLTTVKERDAIAAVVDNNLRLVLSAGKRKAHKDKLKELSDEHKDTLRCLNLRGTDVVEELMLTTVDEEVVSNKNGSTVRDMIEASAKHRKGEESLPKLKICLSRLRELDRNCLRIEDLRKSRWVVNDTELLSVCWAIYGENRPNWLRFSCPEIIAEFDKEIRDTVVKQSVEQINTSRDEIKEWGDQNVDPESELNSTIKAFIASQKDDDGLTGDQAIAEAHRTKVSNQNQMEVLKDMVDSFQEFLREVRARFDWNKEVRSACEDAQRKLVTGSRVLEKKITKFWNDFDTTLVSRRSVECKDLLRSKSVENTDKRTAERQEWINEKEGFRTEINDITKRLWAKDDENKKLREESERLKAENIALQDQVDGSKKPELTKMASSASSGDLLTTGGTAVSGK